MNIKQQAEKIYRNGGAVVPVEAAEDILEALKSYPGYYFADRKIDGLLLIEKAKGGRK